MIDLKLTDKEAHELFLWLRSVPHTQPPEEITEIEYRLWEYIRNANAT